MLEALASLRLDVRRWSSARFRCFPGIPTPCGPQRLLVLVPSSGKLTPEDEG